MSTPQVEDGYTRFANELLDEIIRFPFTKRQYKVMLLLARKTYGFNKKTDDMTVTQISNQTGLTRPHASGTLAELVELQCVLKRDGKHGYMLGINKNYRMWGASRNGTCPETGITPSQNGTVSVPKRDIQKTTPKDNTKRQSAQIGIKKFLDQCKAEKIQPVPPEDPVFKYADKTGIPHDWLHLCWLEFVERSIESGKRYADWRAAFRNCVRSNWYKLWWAKPEGDMGLTTTGVMAQRKHSQEAVNG